MPPLGPSPSSVRSLTAEAGAAFLLVVPHSVYSALLGHQLPAASVAGSDWKSAASELHLLHSAVEPYELTLQAGDDRAHLVDRGDALDGLGVRVEPHLVRPAQRRGHPAPADGTSP